MILDLMVHAPDRESFIAGMVANGFATISDDGSLRPAEGVAIDEIGPIHEIVSYAENGEPIVSAIAGWHVNLRGFGGLAEQMTSGLEQFDVEGNLRPLFERTHILTAIPGLVWTPTTAGVPGGYTGAHGVRIYDPAAVGSPFRRWA